MILATLILCLLALLLIFVAPPMIVASLVLSLLTLPTLFLMLPVFVFPPAAFVCGYLGYRRAVQQAPQAAGWGKRVLYALPMLLALAVFTFAFWLITTQYKA